jgi:hypothetical protein
MSAGRFLIFHFLSFWERFRYGARDLRSLAVTPCKSGRILIFLVLGHDLDVVQGTKGPLPSPRVKVADIKFSGRSLAVTPCESGGRILIFLVLEMI